MQSLKILRLNLKSKLSGSRLSPLLPAVLPAVVLAGFLAVLLAGCAGSEGSEAVPSEQPGASELAAPSETAWVSYAGEGWQFSAPPDWREDASPNEQTLLVLLPPSTPKSQPEPAPEHFTLTAVDLSLITSERLRTLEGMIESNLATMGLLIPEWNLERQAEVSLDGQPAGHLPYTGQAGPHPMRWDQWYAVHQGKAWILNFGCGTERYTQLAPVVYGMVEGFGW